MIIFAVIGIICYVAGVFGFAQIVGSLQNVAYRGIGATLFTIILWLAILGGGVWIVLAFFKTYLWAMILGYGISLLQVLCAGKIR